MSENEEIQHTFSDLPDDTTTSRDGDRNEASESASGEDAGRLLAVKNEEIQSLQEKYLRLAAEFENYKRLSQRDQREQTRFANESVLKELLPILDNLERAVSCAQDHAGGQGLIQGVELTLKQFHETLGKFGVRPVAGLGEPFNPSCHQAVVQQESDTAPQNTVVEVYQKGYFLHDRLLRAAMVAVAIPPTGGDRDNGATPATEAS